MKRNLYIPVVLISAFLAFSACGQKTEDECAQPMIENIETAISKGDYQSALDSIVKLRDRYPKAVNARKRALELWQDASLMKAQHEVEVTDSALQAILSQIDSAPTLLEQNLLRNKCDSLKARYDAECGVVRIIKKQISDRNE